MYMSVLSSLSVDEKLDLIAKLTNSIRNTYTKEQDIETEDPFACYEGDWGGNMSAEDIMISWSNALKYCVRQMALMPLNLLVHPLLSQFRTVQSSFEYGQIR